MSKELIIDSMGLSENQKEKLEAYAKSIRKEESPMIMMEIPFTPKQREMVVMALGTWFGVFSHMPFEQFLFSSWEELENDTGGILN